MRISILSDVNNPHTLRWTHALADAGHELLVYTLGAPAMDYFAKVPNVRVETSGVSGQVIGGRQGAFAKLTYLRAVPKLRRALAAFRPDIVHAHYATSYGLVGLLAGYRPLAVSVWGMDVYDAPKSFALRRIVTHVLRRADVVLSTSHVMRDRSLRLVDRRIEVVPFGVDVQRFKPSEGASDILTIGTVKALEPKYGIEYLVRAFARLPEHGIDLERARLSIVGDGALLHALNTLAEELGVSHRVEFAGRVAYDRIHACHQRLDIAVFPSVDDSESFGVSAVEAQACGVPAIVSRVGGLPEVIEDEVTGLVVPPRDVSGLAAAIARLARDEALRRRMGLAARERVTRLYSLEACVAQLEAILAGAVPGE